jgi:hypothetical protein
MLSHTPASSHHSHGGEEYDYDELDTAYAEDDDWAWEVEAEDALPAGLVLTPMEEVLFGYNVGAQSGSSDGIMDLVVSLTAPVEDGGVPPALLHLLADPQGCDIRSPKLRYILLLTVSNTTLCSILVQELCG